MKTSHENIARSRSQIKPDRKAYLAFSHLYEVHAVAAIGQHYSQIIN